MPNAGHFARGILSVREFSADRTDTRMKVNAFREVSDLRCPCQNNARNRRKNSLKIKYFSKQFLLEQL